MYKNYLFDLDGTLLPMDVKKFVELYMVSICKCLVPRVGIDAKTLSDCIWQGMEAMLRNDGLRLNSDVFWEAADKASGIKLSEHSEDFDYYYCNDFISAKQSTQTTPYAKMCVDLIKEKGARLIVATNPVFPKEATYRRLEWAGISPDDFDRVTVYDNSTSCKPNLNYYEEICSVCGIVPEESLMVGNDVNEDMCAAHLGFDVYLITDCMINRHGKDISFIRHGSFADFYEFLKHDLSKD